MTQQCPEYPKCQDRRVADAEWRGSVSATLISIQASVSKIEERVIRDDESMKKLYFKIGGISAILSITVAILFKLVWQ